MVLVKSGGGVRFARSSTTVAERTERGREGEREVRKKMMKKREDAIGERFCERERKVVLSFFW